jgi:DNA-binding winged helix-turn-helix (wHTH) protein
VRYRFGEWLLDRESRVLCRADTPVSVQPKHFELLTLLIERRPAVVTKNEIFRRLWPDVVVEEANVHNLVSDLRKILDDGDHQWLRTVHRFGYSFAGEAAEEAGEGKASAFELRIGARSYPLLEGENLIGRDEKATVLIDAPGISRLHARITIAGQIATVEDLGSKNGTFVGTRRINAPTAVREGDPLVFARLAAIFCRRRSRSTTITER